MNNKKLPNKQKPTKKRFLRKTLLSCGVLIPILGLTTLAIIYLKPKNEEPFSPESDSSLALAKKDKEKFEDLKNIHLTYSVSPLKIGKISWSDLNILPGVSLPAEIKEVERQYYVDQLDTDQGTAIIKISFYCQQKILETTEITISGFIPYYEYDELSSITSLKELANLDKNLFNSYYPRILENKQMLKIGPTSENELENYMGLSLPTPVPGIKRTYYINQIIEASGQAKILVNFIANRKVLTQTTFTISGFETIYQQNMAKEANQLIDYEINLFDNLEFEAKNSPVLPAKGLITEKALIELTKINLPLSLEKVTRRYEVEVVDQQKGLILIKVTFSAPFGLSKTLYIQIKGFQTFPISSDLEILHQVNEEQTILNSSLSKSSLATKLDPEVQSSNIQYLTPTLIHHFGLTHNFQDDYLYKFKIENNAILIFASKNGRDATINPKPIVLNPSLDEQALIKEKNQIITKMRNDFLFENLITTKPALQLVLGFEFQQDLWYEISNLIGYSQQLFIETINNLATGLPLLILYDDFYGDLLIKIDDIIKNYLIDYFLDKMQIKYFAIFISYSGLSDFIDLITLIDFIEMNNPYYILENYQFIMNKYLKIFQKMLSEGSFTSIRISEGFKLPPEINEIPEKAFYNATIPSTLINWANITKIGENAFDSAKFNENFVMSNKLEYPKHGKNMQIKQNLKWSEQKETNDAWNPALYWPQDGEKVIAKWL